MKERVKERGGREGKRKTGREGGRGNSWREREGEREMEKESTVHARKAYSAFTPWMTLFLSTEVIAECGGKQWFQ